MAAFKSITTVKYIHGVKTKNGNHLIKNCGNAIIGSMLYEMDMN